MDNHEAFATTWTIYYRMKRLDPKYLKDIRDTMLDFLKENKYIIMTPMTQEEFESDKYA